MLSSADLHLERALVLTALALFLGAGISFTLIIFIINSIRKNIKGTLLRPFVPHFRNYCSSFSSIIFLQHFN